MDYCITYWLYNTVLNSIKDDDSLNRSDLTEEGEVGLVESSEDSGGSADSDISDNSLNLANAVDSIDEDDCSDGESIDEQLMALEYALEEVQYNPDSLDSRLYLSNLFKEMMNEMMEMDTRGNDNEELGSRL